jgi:hypothetical protein
MIKKQLKITIIMFFSSNSGRIKGTANACNLFSDFPITVE